MEETLADLVSMYQTARARERAGQAAYPRLAAAAKALGDLDPPTLP